MYARSLTNESETNNVRGGSELYQEVFPYPISVPPETFDRLSRSSDQVVARLVGGSTEEVAGSPAMGESIETHPRKMLTRREFLLGIGASMGALALPKFGQPLTSAESFYGTKPPYYEINWGALEPLKITTEHPKWGPYYQYYVDRIREIASHSPNFWNFMQESVEYLNSVYAEYHVPEEQVTNLVPSGSNPSELMERIVKKRIMRCYEITLLAQYALRVGNNVRTTFRILGWVAENYGGEYMIHSHLQAYMTADGDKSRKPYVLELTNGTIMPEHAYFDYLNRVFRFREGIVHVNSVPTGL